MRKTTTSGTSRKQPQGKLIDLPAKQRQAPLQLIEKWAETICAHGDDAETRVPAFLLLMDELERSARDFQRTTEIIWIAQRAAFAKSDQAEEAQRELVEKLRAKHGLRVVQKRERKTG